MRLLGALSASILSLTLTGAGCQQAAPAPKAQQPINLLGDLETRVTTSTFVTSSGKADNSVIVNTLGMRMVAVQPGTFAMGSPMNEAGRQDDEFRHEVRIARKFHIGATEVTQGQWRTVMKTQPWHQQRGAVPGKDQPATHMTYAEAELFCVLLGRMENAQYRLPSEAEWEFACRGGAGGGGGGPYGTDGAVNDFAWTDANTPHNNAGAVAKKAANRLGLFDMHGNVAEWCADWYGAYPRETVADPKGPATGEYRVVRGGGWDSSPRFCRSAYRSGMDPQTSSDSVGLRVVLVK